MIYDALKTRRIVHTCSALAQWLLSSPVEGTGLWIFFRVIQPFIFRTNPSFDGGNGVWRLVWIQTNLRQRRWKLNLPYVRVQIDLAQEDETSSGSAFVAEGSAVYDGVRFHSLLSVNLKYKYRWQAKFPSTFPNSETNNTNDKSIKFDRESWVLRILSSPSPEFSESSSFKLVVDPVFAIRLKSWQGQHQFYELEVDRSFE